MGRRGALWIVVAVLAAVLAALGVGLRSGSGDDEPKATSQADDAPSSARVRNGPHYVIAADLPELGGRAPAYRLPRAPSEAAKARLAEALGVRAMDLRFDSFGQWSYSADGGADVDTTETTVPVRPAHLPTEAEARRIAVDLLGRVGVATSGARIQVQDLTAVLQATVEPRLDGFPASGLVSYVEVGDNGVVTWASGRLGTPRTLAGYDLVDTAAAVERLNAGGASYGWSVDPWPGPTVVDDPTGSTAPLGPDRVTITGAEVVLQLQQPSDGGPGYLVPFYRFTADDGSTPEVAAASDANLQRPPR